MEIGFNHKTNTVRVQATTVVIKENFKTRFRFFNFQPNKYIKKVSADEVIIRIETTIATEKN